MTQGQLWKRVEVLDMGKEHTKFQLPSIKVSKLWLPENEQKIKACFVLPHPLAPLAAQQNGLIIILLW